MPNKEPETNTDPIRFKHEGKRVWFGVRDVLIWRTAIGLCVGTISIKSFFFDGSQKANDRWQSIIEAKLSEQSSDLSVLKTKVDIIQGIVLHNKSVALAEAVAKTNKFDAFYQ
jgi:hypothetical protein